MPITERSFNPSHNPRIDDIKAKALEFERVIIESTPEGRRRDIALTHLEAAAMFAVKSAARGDE